MMSNQNCLLCGIWILDELPSDSEKWLCEYRIVYRDNLGAHVTGLGNACNNTTLLTPRNPAMRWSDIDGDPEHSEDMIEIPLMHEEEVDGVHGYLIHDACWNLLHEASKPVNISLDRLIYVCESLPCPASVSGLGWGHTYGGHQKLMLGDDAYPWQERFSPLSGEILDEMGASINPLDGIDISALSGLIEHAPKRVETKTISTITTSSSGDPFSRLPWELLEMIAKRVQTIDALNLRLASRSFDFVFSSIAFWMSRFSPDGERGFLFEVRLDPELRELSKLQSLYRLSRPSAAAPELINRDRVWRLARWLNPLIRPIHTDDSPPECSSDCSQWVCVSGKEFILDPDEGDQFIEGCRTTTTISVDTDGITKIGIYLLSTGVWDYVTGIRLLYRDGQETLIGYAYDENEVVVNITELKGFRMAMGLSGLMGLQIEGGQSRRWIGCTDGVPRTNRLLAQSPLKGLRVALDGFKVTGLGICVEQPEHEAQNDFRNVALWYPDVPPANLILNEQSYTGQHPLDAGYSPLCWVHFGGEAGKSLQYLEGVLATHATNIHALRFVYSETHDRRYSDKLGCSRKHGETLFPIDGAGGELIQDITVGIRRYPTATTYPFLLHGIPKFIKMTTNRGKTIEIGENSDGLNLQHLHIALDTTITGFYGTHATSYGLTSIGVISERIKDS